MQAPGISCTQLGLLHAQQAYWFKRSDFKKKNMEFTEYFLEIGTEADLCNWLDTISSPPPIPAIMS
ncbi:MAG: hypothetical protein EBU92_09545 [Betaproteobacteria bacterium]|nr:hypothetical protein [Betaproteobacteria bacterium]